jgi:spermidine synthase
VQSSAAASNDDSLMDLTNNLNLEASHSRADEELEERTNAPSLLRARIGVGLISLAAMLLELSLTRLFSVVLFYHFAFLAISIALLGLGAGGVCAYLRREQLARLETSRIAGWAAVVASLATVCVLELVLHARVSLTLEWKTFWALTAVYVGSAIPFAMVGASLSVVFSRAGERVPKLYGADLTGAALACMAVVPLLNVVGGPNTVLAAALAFAGAGVVWLTSARERRRAVGLSVALLVLMAANYRGRLFDILFAKGMYRDPSMVEFARWNAISRVEVDDQHGGKAIVIDADANTYVMGVRPEGWAGTEWQKNLMAAAPSVVNRLRPEGKYAIIGPGGGVDVLRALANGSHDVTGIEINPLIATDIMRKDPRYVAYSQGLYLRPDVHIKVSDGRSYVRQTDEKFDVVQMTLVDTWASTAAGAFALTENNLYTVEAFDEYFAHLKPDGLLAITRWEFQYPREALRVVATAMASLKGLGVEDPSMNVLVVSDGPLNEDGKSVLVLAKKSAFTREEEQAVYAHLKENPRLQLIYAPHDRGQAIGMNPKNKQVRWNPFTALLVSNDVTGFAKNYEFNVAPVSDDAPFFFFTVKLGHIFGERSGAERGIDWKVNMGVAVLLGVLALSVLTVAGFIVVPLCLHAPAREVGARPLLYFLFVGLGYILVEIAFLQRFVLFLGHPTYALTVVVFLMLMMSGAGSWGSGAVGGGGLWVALAAIAGYVVVAAFGFPWVFHAFLGSALWTKILISLVLIGPGAFLMGMPFPTGLRGLGDGRGAAVEWAWAVNASASVLGSVLSVVIAMEWGVRVTLLCGAAAYVAAMVCWKLVGARVIHQSVIPERG